MLTHNSWGEEKERADILSIVLFMNYLEAK